MRRFIKHFVTFNTSSGQPINVANAETRTIKLAKKFNQISFIFLIASTLLLQLPAAYGKVIRLDEVDLAGKHFDYVYQWSDPEIQPKAIIITLHGLLMHGLVYDKIARHLAQEGVLVLSPDLPGYGRRWHKEPINSLKARDNVIEIIQSAKTVYKNLPVICMGESLGANLSIAAAQSRPDLVDGIILSSPALKTRLKLSPKSILGRANMVVSLVKTDNEVDLSPFMKAYATEDPIILQAMLNDPLIHSQIKCQELWDSFQSMSPVIKNAKLISKNTPVLIMQGKQDQILKPSAIIKLVSNLNSEDQTVKWFKDRGHMLIEECQPKNDAMQTIDNWLQSHITRMDNQLIGNKESPPAPVTSSLPLSSAGTTLNTNVAQQ